MNITLDTTLRAIGEKRKSERVFPSAEHYMDVKLSQDIGNVTRSVSKVRSVNLNISQFHSCYFDLYSKLLVAKSTTNTTRRMEDDEEINQFYFYEVSLKFILNIFRLHKYLFGKTFGQLSSPTEIKHW